MEGQDDSGRHDIVQAGSHLCRSSVRWQRPRATGGGGSRTSLVSKVGAWTLAASRARSRSAEARCAHQPCKRVAVAIAEDANGAPLLLPAHVHPLNVGPSHTEEIAEERVRCGEENMKNADVKTEGIVARHSGIGSGAPSTESKEGPTQQGLCGRQRQRASTALRCHRPGMSRATVVLTPSADARSGVSTPRLRDCLQAAGGARGAGSQASCQRREGGSLALREAVCPLLRQEGESC